MRIIIVVKRLEESRYQAQLRISAAGNHIFFSRREGRASAAKRAAELLFGPLDWKEPSAALRAAEPEINQVAYINVDVRQI